MLLEHYLQVWKSIGITYSQYGWKWMRVFEKYVPIWESDRKGEKRRIELETERLISIPVQISIRTSFRWKKFPTDLEDFFLFFGETHTDQGLDRMVPKWLSMYCGCGRLWKSWVCSVGWNTFVIHLDRV